MTALAVGHNFELWVLSHSTCESLIRKGFERVARVNEAC